MLQRLVDDDIYFELQDKKARSKALAAPATASGSAADSAAGSAGSAGRELPQLIRPAADSDSDDEMPFMRGMGRPRRANAYRLAPHEQEEATWSD
jgi:hypothetical protein